MTFNMKQSLLAAFFLLLICNHFVVGQTEEINNSHAPAISVTTGALSIRPDVAFARSVMGNNLTGMKGSISESLAESGFLQKDSEGRFWKSLRPRSGSQGLDHIFINLDEKGLPHDLMIAESKFGSSQLGQTKDGIQMGGQWKNKRIVALGNRYADIAKDKNIRPGKRPFSINNHVNNVFLKNGKEVCFWRENANSAWKFDGDIIHLPEALKQAENYGVFLRAAGNGTISYRSRIFHINPEGNDVRVTIHNADNIPPHTGLSKLPVTGEFRITGALDKKGLISDDACQLLARKMVTACDLPEQEAMQIAKNCQKNMTMRQAITPYSQPKAITMNSGLMGAGAITLDAIIQLALTQDISYKQLAYSGSVAAIGGVLVQGIEQFAIRKGVSISPFGSTATTRVMPKNFMRGTAIFAAIDLLTNYGLAIGGVISWNEAHQSAMASAITFTASGLTYGAFMAAPAAFGAVASTGTAISSLSGAAAVNATLAFYGGGSIAAGGGGAFIGSIVVGGGVALVAIGCGYIIYECIQLYDESQEKKKILILADFYSKTENWKEILHYQLE